MNNIIDLNRPTLEKTHSALDLLLADYHIYYQNLRNYHWNVKGEHFFDLHGQFENLYNSAKSDIDEVAERILTLGYRPTSRFANYLEISRIEEKDCTSAIDMVRKIVSDQKAIMSGMREVIKEAAEVGDEGTIDLVGGLLSAIEKEAWKLASWATQVKASSEVGSRLPN